MFNPRRLYQQFTQKLANGVNAAGEVLVEDIRAQVPVKTGKLRASYRIRRPAQPGNLKAEIGPPPQYGAKYYPFRHEKAAFGRRQAQRPPKLRFFGEPKQEYRKKRTELVRKRIIVELRGRNGR
jgi:hypothetical protein